MCRFLLAAAFGLLTSGAAQADPILEYSAGNYFGFFNLGPNTLGWQFTTGSQPVTVNGLDILAQSNSGANVRIYNGLGTVFASGTVLTSDPIVGSPAQFFSLAITPVTLTANTIYYIAEDGAQYANYGASGITTNPAITYGFGVSATSAGANPTTDAYGLGTSSYFGPNFETAVPEPSSFVLLGATAGLAFRGWRFSRRRNLARARALPLVFEPL